MRFLKTEECVEQIKQSWLCLIYFIFFIFYTDSPENQKVLGQAVSDKLSQPMRNTGTVNNTMKSPPASKSASVAPPIARQATPRPSVTQDVTVEKFSGLRLKCVFCVL